VAIEFLMEVFRNNRHKDAIVWEDQTYKYDWLLRRVEHWKNFIASEGVTPGTVVILEADFSPNSVALFLALVDRSCILVPLTSSVQAKKSEFIEVAQGEVTFQIAADDNVAIRRFTRIANHDIYRDLREQRQSGFVLFSSGSTGKSKAAVHDFSRLLPKFQMPRRSLRTVTFLLYDHIGGINTMLYSLSNAGCMITLQNRDPDYVLRIVEDYKVELLPTSPTFINLILLSEAYHHHDLSSLKIVTYGTEPMPESTLKRFHELFPEMDLRQTYGLSELGILRSKSMSSDSLWVKIGGEGFETRVVDDILQIKAHSAMLGYLNAPSPFSEDEWFVTGDVVEVNGDYLRFLGRDSEVINVGGEKVYPAEVESVIQGMDNVAEVVVYSEQNPIMGQVVSARVRISKQEDRKSFALRLKRFCRERLQAYKIPVRIKLVDSKQHGDRFKKIRRS